MDRPVHENNYVKSSLDLSVFEMLKLTRHITLATIKNSKKEKNINNSNKTLKN